jgi:hypothetical protein
MSGAGHDDQFDDFADVVRVQFELLVWSRVAAVCRPGWRSLIGRQEPALSGVTPGSPVVLRTTVRPADVAPRLDHSLRTAGRSGDEPEP